MGSGYGPYKGETLRIYASPNVPIEKFKEVALEIRHVINQMEEDGEVLKERRPHKSRNLDEVLDTTEENGIGEDNAKKQFSG